ncbi:arsenate reductase ArsC [Chloroflexota bacterium]
MKSQKKVIFLCTGNSCRSQMAEALVNDHLGDRWLAVSAGTKPAGYVHPKAVQVLAEWGILHEGESKLADQFCNWEFDLVVTVCDSAAEECPVWLGQDHSVHHSFPDPADAKGSDQEITAKFRLVRDAIAKEIPGLLQEHAS